MNPIQKPVKIAPAFRPHVLVVEDEINVAKGLKMVMTEGGYNVELAETGQEALEKFKDRDFDLVVADLRLPDLDGLEVIQRIWEGSPKTKVLIITGYPSVTSAVQAVKLGVLDFLRKPFTEEEFMAAVGMALTDKGKKTMEELIMETQNERLIQRKEVLRVLERASQNHDFFRDLMESGSEALKDYRLSRTAKAAIVAGNVDWIRKNVGELSEEQLGFIYQVGDKDDG